MGIVGAETAVVLSVVRSRQFAAVHQNLRYIYGTAALRQLRCLGFAFKPSLSQNELLLCIISAAINQRPQAAV
jgi:hypothetical protein